jgi:hypothetical protein
MQRRLAEPWHVVSVERVPDDPQAIEGVPVRTGQR